MGAEIADLIERFSVALTPSTAVAHVSRHAPRGDHNRGFP